MKHTLLTTLAFLAATSVSAWEVQKTVDPFDETVTSFKYVKGTILLNYGQDHRKTPSLHLYNRKDDISPIGKKPITSRSWALIPGDSYICHETKDVALYIDVKIDGEILSREFPSFKYVDGKLIEEQTTQYGIAAFIGARKDSLIVTHRHNGKDDDSGYAYQDFAERLELAKEVVLRYRDTCGNGGVFKFNPTKTEVSS